MRRRRKMPSGYRSGYHIGAKKKSHKKLIIRIAFSVTAAAVMVSLAILLGLHLDSKAEEAAARTENSDSIYNAPAPETADLYPDGIKSTSSAASLKVTAADIDVTGADSDDIENTVARLSTKYNAISVRITDSGRLVYLSPAMLAYSRLPDNATLTLPSQTTPPVQNGDGDMGDDGDGASQSAVSDPLDNIKAAISAAKLRGLRKCAVFTASGSVLSDDTAAELDCVIIGELAALGFDEVIIDGLASESADISAEKVAPIVTYLAKLRRVSGSMDIGITLPAAVYLDAPAASSIKTLSEYADLLAIDISSNAENADDAYTAVYDGYYSLKGNFSVYNIRGMITDASPETAEAAFAALKDLADASVQFSVFVNDPSYTPAVSDPGDGNDSDPDANRNPNAMTSDNHNPNTSGTDDFLN